MADKKDIDGNVAKGFKKSERKTLFAMANDLNSDLMKSYSDNPEDNRSLSDIIGITAGSTKTVKKTTVPRIAFTENPVTRDNYFGLYKNKRGLIDDHVIKKIRQEDHLVAAILRARGQTMSMFGRMRKDRFDIGIECNIKEEYDGVLTPDQRIKIQERIDKTMALLINCGHNSGVSTEERMLLSEFFFLSAQNGLAFGRFTTEVIYDEDDEGIKSFHRFRPTDAGSIKRAVRRGEYADDVRQSSIKLLEELTGCKIDPSTAMAGDYSWIQVVEGTPRQAFTQDEMLVSTLFPSTDIEHNGYPLTPLDTIMQAVTTHISIETYNRLYFQNGRATKGMMIIQSDDIDQATLEGIKQQFNASINSVGNSFRTPIFGIGVEDNIQYIGTDQTKKDGEFQFLYDAVARTIMSAFSISPSELPSMSHLDSATNSQSLSESSNEWKLTAARDTGIRPLILKFQDFLNEKLFPIMDPELSQICTIEMSGLDAETRTDEATRLQTDSDLHYNFDAILGETDKTPVGESMGGEIFFNERWQLIADKYVDVSSIAGKMIDPSGYCDRTLKYKRDAFWFQNMDLLGQFNPNAVKAFYAYRKDSVDLLKMLSQDMLDEDDE